MIGTPVSDITTVHTHMNKQVKIWCNEKLRLPKHFKKNPWEIKGDIIICADFSSFSSISAPSTPSNIHNTQWVPGQIRFQSSALTWGKALGWGWLVEMVPGARWARENKRYRHILSSTIQGQSQKIQIAQNHQGKFQTGNKRKIQANEEPGITDWERNGDIQSGE